MYERFSQAARTIMQLANKEAMQSDHAYIGTIDVLIAMVTTADDVGVKMLRSQGIYSSEIRSEIAKTPMVGIEDGFPRVKNIVESAIKVAQELNHTEVDSVHLLLGVLNDQTSIACRALAGLGMNLDQLRSEILSRLTPGSASEIAHRKSLEARFQNHPRVQSLKHRIKHLQDRLEESVKAMDFDQAATYRDQRVELERTLEDLYPELEREQS
jgi:ATP-dependent Clp protease ATP-binding subunit ClpA